MISQRSLRLNLVVLRICAVTFFVVMVDVTKFAIEGAPNELLYSDDLVLMSETIEGLGNQFLK